MMRIETPKFALAITVVTGVLATVLGIWATTFPESHPQYMGDLKSMLSWSAREIGMGLSCLAAVLFFRDARVIAAVLLGAWTREVLDFVDFFRLEHTPARLYAVVGTSVVLHSVALVLTHRAIQKPVYRSIESV